jgi:flagellar motor protein MotB
MRGFAGWSLWLLPLVGFGLAVSGCAQNAYTLQSQVQALQQQQQVLAQQNQELQTRAVALDKDNQDAKALLAQEKQQGRIFQDEVAALREQLRTTAAQLAEASKAKEQSDARALMASSRRPVGASISANSSLLGDLPKISIPGVEVRQDGDVVRIELPADQLFHDRSATLKPGSEQLLGDVAQRIMQAYRDQMIGIEGHTDSDPAVPGLGLSNAQLSNNQAMAVQAYLVTQARVPETHLFVAGHGGNHPVVSNATPAGKQRNRRVELVVYPEKAAR